MVRKRQACVEISLDTIYQELQETRGELEAVNRKIDTFNNLMLSTLAVASTGFIIILGHVTGIVL